MTRFSVLTKVLSVALVAVLLLGVILVLKPGADRHYVTAKFPRAVSLYSGSDVRVLGVPVGKVESVTPAGTDVVVKMWYDAKYDVPADAKAVIVSPAIVGDRFVQLTPVYRHGPKLADGATINTNRTATPLELDQIYQSIDDLSVALGPQGANRKGALTNLLNSTARNFAGEGDQFHQTIANLGRLTGTLANNKDELFGTASQIERFVSALAKNDKTVRSFNQSLAGASDVLSDERKDLAAALKNLAVALHDVSGFVHQNKHELSQNISGLNRLTKVLVKQRGALSETLKDAPLALNNLYLTYNPSTGTLDTRANVGEAFNLLQRNPAGFLCSFAKQTPGGDQVCHVIKGALGGASRSAPFAGRKRSDERAGDVEHIDRSLGGLVGVNR